MLILKDSEKNLLFQNLRAFWKYKLAPEEELIYFVAFPTEAFLYSRDTRYYVNIEDLNDTTNIVIIQLLKKENYREEIIFFASKDFSTLDVVYYFVFQDNKKYSFNFHTRKFSSSKFSPIFTNLDKIGE